LADEAAQAEREQQAAIDAARDADAQVEVDRLAAELRLKLDLRIRQAAAGELGAR
jgi:hypothetical protein